MYIFDLAANHFDPRKALGPSIDIGNDSPWSKDLRMKKALVRVWQKLANHGEASSISPRILASHRPTLRAGEGLGGQFKRR